MTHSKEISDKCISKVLMELGHENYAEKNLGLECAKCDGKDSNYCFRSVNQFKVYFAPNKVEGLK